MKNLISLLLVMALSLIFNLLNIRVCLFFTFFKIPCPACGFTRAVLLILKGNFLESIQYNILPIILLILFLFFPTIKKYFQKYPKFSFFVFFLLTLFIWYINIHNPLLY